MHQLGQIFVSFPWHIAVRTVLTVADDSGPLGTVTTGRTVPISYSADVDDRIHPFHLAALLLAIASPGD